MELPGLLRQRITLEESEWFRFYDEGKCVYITKLQNEDAQSEVLHTAEQKTVWMQKVRLPSQRFISHRDFLTHNVPHSLLEHVINDDGEELTHPRHIPLSSQHFNEMQHLFHVHSNITRIISRNNADISRVRNTKDNSISVTYHTGSPSGVAAASTYFFDTQTTFAVVFGVNLDAKRELVKRIRECHRQETYPLLVPGILAEAEKKIAKNRVDELVDDFVDTIERIQDMVKGDGQAELGGNEICSWIELYRNARDFIRSLKATKRQLGRQLEYHNEIADELGRASSLRSGSTTTPTPTPNSNIPGTTDPNPQTGPPHRAASPIEPGISERLTALQWDYDAKINECEMVMTDLSFVYQVSMAHLARQESKTNTRIADESKRIAERAGRDGKQMKSLAVLGAIYLPMTSVASIFSMEVFDWRAASGSGVVSKYFYVYLGIAVVLTICTLTAGWVFVMKPTAAEREHHGNGKTHKVYMGGDCC
ncbi:hypothetical protein MKZ38_007304 [Zalerion maritima]|uniref:Uncharacterized protein n=1 Tax=Zalerion maritima TaxID=339359 RepID=A0AAD5RIL1_9PEZI|nr:hypothetical protein MKZ38_007304 [Zalerion maritima]